MVRRDRERLRPQTESRWVGGAIRARSGWGRMSRGLCDTIDAAPRQTVRPEQYGDQGLVNKGGVDGEVREGSGGDREKDEKGSGGGPRERGRDGIWRREMREMRTPGPRKIRWEREEMRDDRRAGRVGGERIVGRGREGLGGWIDLGWSSVVLVEVVSGERAVEESMSSGVSIASRDQRNVDWDREGGTALRDLKGLDESERMRDGSILRSERGCVEEDGMDGGDNRVFVEHLMRESERREEEMRELPTYRKRTGEKDGTEEGGGETERRDASRGDSEARMRASWWRVGVEKGRTRGGRGDGVGRRRETGDGEGERERKRCGIENVGREKRDEEQRNWGDRTRRLERVEQASVRKGRENKMEWVVRDGGRGWMGVGRDREVMRWREEVVRRRGQRRRSKEKMGRREEGDAEKGKWQ
ncbi:hypothetical protein Tco_0261209 [Tanacetum coccineum]